ncbi:MAG TPA: inositol monophosphatase family protein [Acidimicrobiales bacterium]|nr:inositol monophosphatase family protein [Acidimicrobiales bacterium]
MTDDRLIAVLNEAASAVRDALETLEDWGLAGTRAGQYHSDLLADEVAVAILVAGGLGVLSEETGLHHPERAVMVALDPVDGSTNAARKLPWYATSLCAVDAAGARAAVVVNLATGDRYEAVRGSGATWNGCPLAVSGCNDIGDAVVCVNGWPGAHLGWRQMRAMGATALDICAVGSGQLDAYIDCSEHANAPWDYLGGVLVCREAGGLVADAGGRELVTLGLTERRTPVAAATEKLLDQALEARAGLP